MLSVVTIQCAFLLTPSCRKITIPSHWFWACSWGLFWSKTCRWKCSMPLVKEVQRYYLVLPSLFYMSLDKSYVGVAPICLIGIEEARWLEHVTWHTRLIVVSHWDLGVLYCWLQHSAWTDWQNRWQSELQPASNRASPESPRVISFLWSDPFKSDTFFLWILCGPSRFLIETEIRHLSCGICLWRAGKLFCQIEIPLSSKRKPLFNLFLPLALKLCVGKNY